MVFLFAALRARSVSRLAAFSDTVKAPRLFDHVSSAANDSLCPFRDRPFGSLNCPCGPSFRVAVNLKSLHRRTIRSPPTRIPERARPAFQSEWADIGCLEDEDEP